MIEVKTDKGRKSIKMLGNLSVLLADTTCILQAVHDSLPEDLRVDFRREMHRYTAEDGLCWMTSEQKRGKAKELLKLLGLIDKEPMEATKDYLNNEVLVHLDRVAEWITREIGGAVL